MFRGERVPRVTRSVVAIWNNGNVTLLGKEVVSREPLRVEFDEDCRVIDVSLLAATRDVNQFKPSIKTTNSVLFKFDFLDPRDGAVVMILHTGGPAAAVLGTVRGMPKGPLDLGGIDERGRTDIWNFLSNVVLFVLASILLVPLAFFLKTDGAFSWYAFREWVGSSFFFLVIAAFVMYEVYRRWVRSTLPKVLADYNR